MDGGMNNAAEYESVENQTGDKVERGLSLTRSYVITGILNQTTNVMGKNSCVFVCVCWKRDKK